MIEMKKQITPGETPEKITVSMIDQDLKDGISKPEMAIKYGIKPWEVDEMFKHQFLKGRRPSRKKTLSFTFVDDTEPTDNGTITAAQDVEVTECKTTHITDPEEFIDPNQVTLEDAIEESTKEIETAVNGLSDVNNAIVDMLGPHTQTPEETPEETLLKAANGEIIDELDAAKPRYEQPEEEIEIDDNIFEL